MTITLADTQPIDPSKPDPFFIHEALDRTHVMLCMVEEHLGSHPAVLMYPDVREKVTTALDALATAYQLIGAKGD